MNDCVFCGQPIHAGQPTAGRPPMAAHATCADAALADDRHWDAVAAASPMEDGADAAASPESRPGGASRSGCLTLGAALVGSLAAVTGLFWRR